MCPVFSETLKSIFSVENECDEILLLFFGGTGI
jgi:hypothetical protein